MKDHEMQKASCRIRRNAENAALQKEIAKAVERLLKRRTSCRG